jgi:hypothetical protein
MAMTEEASGLVERQDRLPPPGRNGLKNWFSSRLIQSFILQLITNDRFAIIYWTCNRLQDYWLVFKDMHKMALTCISDYEAGNISVLYKTQSTQVFRQ